MIRLERESQYQKFTNMTDDAAFLGWFNGSAQNDEQVLYARLLQLMVQFGLDFKNGFNDLLRKAIVKGWVNGTDSMKVLAVYRRLIFEPEGYSAEA